MPIASGSLSCRCFQVSGNPPANFRDVYPLEIERHSFKPPQVDRGEMRSAGWVNPRRILDILPRRRRGLKRALARKRAFQRSHQGARVADSEPGIDFRHLSRQFRGEPLRQTSHDRNNPAPTRFLVLNGIKNGFDGLGSRAFYEPARIDHDHVGV